MCMCECECECARSTTYTLHTIHNSLKLLSERDLHDAIFVAGGLAGSLP